jgi:hypothetical protein
LPPFDKFIYIIARKSIEKQEFAEKHKLVDFGDKDTITTISNLRTYIAVIVRHRCNQDCWNPFSAVENQVID